MERPNRLSVSIFGSIAVRCLRLPATGLSHPPNCIMPAKRLRRLGLTHHAGGSRVRSTPGTLADLDSHPNRTDLLAKISVLVDVLQPICHLQALCLGTDPPFELGVADRIEPRLEIAARLEPVTDQIVPCHKRKRIQFLCGRV